MTMIGALVLAAGHSVRFGSDKRLSKTPDGGRLLESTLSLYVDCFPQTTVVLRHGEPAASILSRKIRKRVRVVCADPSPVGLGASIAAGVRESRAWSCACIALADMPWVRRETLRRLISAWDEVEDTRGTTLYPVHAGQAGHPVMFDASLFSDLQALNGDAGAAQVKGRASIQIGVPVNDPGTLDDVDRPHELRT